MRGMVVTYGSILGSLRTAALECDPVALVLETLGSDQTLDLGSLGVWLRALLLGLDLAADDELANLQNGRQTQPLHRIGEEAMRKLTSSSLLRPKKRRSLVARLGPRRLGATVSVTPGMSESPFFTMERARTERSMATMQPRTLFLLRSPVRRGR